MCPWRNIFSSSSHQNSRGLLIWPVGNEQAGREPVAFEQRLRGMEIVGITIIEGNHGRTPGRRP